MRDFIGLLILGFLLLNCLRTEAKTRQQDTIMSQKTFQNELVDSLNVEKDTGIATWYHCRGGLFAASTKFKKGSVLRVINQANDKYVDVIINDYGPNDKKNPDRIIDLDKIAFKKIAHLRTGIISIIIWPLKIF